MTRFIMPIILIAISATIFVMFSNPMYKEIGELRAQAVSYDEALKNSKALENERDKLTAKDNSIDPDNKIKLQKFLPDHVDNIRLILEIEEIALAYNMPIKDVKYSATPDAAKESAGAAAVQGGAAASKGGNKDYGFWDLEFSTTGTYGNFLNFLRDLEKNLRIVDISSVAFSSETISKTSAAPGAATTSSVPETYKYDFKIKTYWLKN